VVVASGGFVAVDGSAEGAEAVGVPWPERPVAARVRFLSLVFLPFALLWLLSMLAVWQQPGLAPFCDPVWIGPATALLGVQVVIFGAFAWVGHRLRGSAGPWDGLLERLFIHAFGMATLVLFVLIGPWTTAFPILLASLPILGVLFFETAVVLRIMAAYAVAWVGVMVLQLAGLLPYAPMLAANPIQEGRLHPGWLVASLITAGGMTLASVWAFLHVQAQQRRLREALDRMARTDALTGLPNRRTLSEALKQRLRQPAGPAPVVLLLDVDHFKEINDTHGHAVGDAVLRLVGEVLGLSDAFGVRDRGRIGGEEFVVLLEVAAGESAPDAAAALRVRLQRLVRARLESESAADVPFTWSAGATCLRPDDTVESVLHRADMALLRAKQQRDRLEWADAWADEAA
jgi:diguanylate cyclase (GGDEF)-like protein